MADETNKTKCIYHTGIVSRIDSLDRILDERQKLCDAEIKSIDKEITIAKVEMDRRLEGMNEFRTQLTSQAGTFISRQELDLMFDKTDDKISALEKYVSQSQGSKKWTDYLIVSIISVIIAMIVSLLVSFV